MVPIVEIPYAKYLDCGADMFFEIVIQNWLSASNKPHGMIVRLQGFDKGLFGGNFHTHNSVEEKFTRNFLENREMRDEILVYESILSKFWTKMVSK